MCANGNRALGGDEPSWGAPRVFRTGRQVATESREIRFGGVGPAALLEFRFVQLNPTRSAVMGASPRTRVSCKECERALRQQRDAVDRWRQFLKASSNSSLSQEPAAFVSTLKHVFDAQSQVVKMRDAYRSHLETHRPGKRRPLEP